MTDQFDVDALIEERSTTHGDYLRNAEITQKIKDILRTGRRYRDMHPAMKETLDMVAHKLHRIVNGDPFFEDHWVDMTGYPHLVVGNWSRIVAWRDAQTTVAPRTVTDEEYETILALRSGRAHVALNPARDTSPDPLDRTVEPAEPVPATTLPDDPPGGVYIALRNPTPQTQPKRATYAEYKAIEELIVPTGSMAGVAWAFLYENKQASDGRWEMREEYRGEYGR